MTQLIHGHLVIFVDGYKYHYKNMVNVIPIDGGHLSIPDRLMPAHVDEIDSMDWWHEGWAVGDNSRNRLCKRYGLDGLRKFHNFDEAVQFCYARQQRFKDQQHVLVYVSKDPLGRDQCNAVRSLDEITAIDNKNEIERQELKVLEAKRDSDTKAQYPELEQFKSIFAPMKAWKIAYRLADIRKQGRDSIKKSTWYRLKKELKAVGFELPDLG